MLKIIELVRQCDGKAVAVAVAVAVRESRAQSFRASLIAKKIVQMLNQQDCKNIGDRDQGRAPRNFYLVT